MSSTVSDKLQFLKILDANTSKTKKINAILRWISNFISTMVNILFPTDFSKAAENAS